MEDEKTKNSYILKVPISLHSRIERHIRMVGYIEDCSIKEKWITDALREKIERNPAYPRPDENRDKFIT